MVTIGTTIAIGFNEMDQTFVDHDMEYQIVNGIQIFPNIASQAST